MERPGTVTSAARILDRSEAYVRTLEKRGVLRAHRTPSGLRIFDLSEVEKLRDELKSQQSKD